MDTTQRRIIVDVFERRESFIILSTLGLIFIFLSIWVLDVAVTSIINDLTLVNGYWKIQPQQIYHIALWIIGTSAYGLFMLGLWGSKPR